MAQRQQIDKAQFAQFEAIYPDLKELLLDHARFYNLPPGDLEILKANLESNLLGGTYDSGMVVPSTVSVLIGATLGREQYKQAAALGWIVELLRASFLMSDDIINGSISRRGKPCWHLQKGIGLTAINDSMILKTSIYYLLKVLFRSHPAYVDLVELFVETSWHTEIGQLCDQFVGASNESARSRLDSSSLPLYNYIVTNKTVYYSFYLPVAVALHFVGKATEINLEHARKITLSIGEYFQVQNDYLEYFGSPEKMGNQGADIRNHKHSWLLCQALESASPPQKEILERNFGSKDQAKRTAIKNLLERFGLNQRYFEFEEKRSEEVSQMIAATDEGAGLKKEVFYALWNKVHDKDM
ncbi:unnamed protein product [Clonostachys byssicola]|uniref:Farnesyl diphosphate synthase n=1 Tax=Clonostachys byssicola TaxID=160290 RepID=A0A9N9Y3R3_9HYPO|nr:unnamed protein product [Clonostachys byssicola]